MKLKPNYIVFLIILIIVSFASYLLSINIWYGFTHNIIIQGDIALPHTINYPNVIILIILTLIVSYTITILIQNFILKQKT